jgi:hypothetical protein
MMATFRDSLTRRLSLGVPLCCLLLVLGWAPARATESAPVVHELGETLTYVRLSDLNMAPPDVSGVIILDLRYAAPPEDPNLPALRPLLQSTGRLRLVLVDAAPSQALRALLNQRDARVLTMGPNGLTPAADFPVKVDPLSDRTAYDALATGMDFNVLAGENQEKERMDEAALIRARVSGVRRPAAPPSAEPEAANPDAPPPPPRDALLQHAIRLARGLQALGRA